MSEEQLRIDALEYHEFPTPGKISIAPTKALANQRDLALAYSPGVAYACLAIAEDPSLQERFLECRLPSDDETTT
jgi:malate dehydrogenase (oxaloacetate-decarboxylating)(NADP+)